MSFWLTLKPALDLGQVTTSVNLRILKDGNEAIFTR